MTARCPTSRQYPRKSDITRAVEAAKACGVDVGGIEVMPTGAIKILDRREARIGSETEFDRWEREGRL